MNVSIKRTFIFLTNEKLQRIRSICHIEIDTKEYLYRGEDILVVLDWYYFYLHGLEVKNLVVR